MKLMTKAIENKLAKYPLYSQDGKNNDEKVVVCKFFFGVFTWYVTEGEKLPNGDYTFFGIVKNDREYHPEWGYFNLSDLTRIKMLGYPVVERDMSFKPCHVSDLGLDI